MLVSFKTAQPQKLPQEHTGKTEQELNQIGFAVCPEPPDVPPGYRLWWEAGQWSVIPVSPAETEIQWQKTKDQAAILLQGSDYKVLKAYENQLPVDPLWIEYRQSLRDIYNNTAGINPFDVNWPTKPE